MNELSDIPVRIAETGKMDSANANQQLSQPVMAILKELQSMLETLVETGDHSYVDIRSIPLLPGDLQSLRQFLGTGEVDAIINALGPTQVTETSISGIWWVTHRNAHNEIISEFIEVTDLPEILKTQHHDLHAAPGQFKQLVAKLNTDTSVTV